MSVAETPPPVRPRPGRWPAIAGPAGGLLAVVVLFVVLIGVRGKLDKFLSPGNMQVLAHEATIPAVLALGMLLVLISGGIDLSVGSTVALVTVVTMQVYRAVYASNGETPLTGVLAVAAGLLTGTLCGLANGLLITAFRLPPFVATLGTLSIARGLAVGLANRTLLAFPDGKTPGWVSRLAEVDGGWSVFNPGFWSVIVLAAGMGLLLHGTIFGRYTFAVGSSEATARLCGVPVRATKLAVYTVAGLLAGWAGVLVFAHGGSGDPSAGEGLELAVIAAVVIGGARLTGGQGTVIGALLGVLILGVLSNGVSLFNVPVEMQYILIGAIILANVALTTRRRAGE